MRCRECVLDYYFMLSSISFTISAQINDRTCHIHQEIEQLLLKRHLGLFQFALEFFESLFSSNSLTSYFISYTRFFDHLSYVVLRFRSICPN